MRHMACKYTTALAFCHLDYDNGAKARLGFSQ